jgi:hypothetical protein
MGRGSECNGFPIDTSDVDAFGYTYLVFSFAGISWSGELEPYDGRSEYSSQYAQFNSLKTKFPGLKTLIAVGIHIMKYLAQKLLAPELMMHWFLISKLN